MRYRIYAKVDDSTTSVCFDDRQDAENFGMRYVENCPGSAVILLELAYEFLDGEKVYSFLSPIL